MSRDTSDAKTPCASCGQKKANAACELCAAALCKKCVQFLDPETFRYLEPRPEVLSRTQYCGPCYVTSVAPEEAAYAERLARARAVVVFVKKKSEESRLMSRSAKPIQVDGCSDEADTLLKLAFVAAGDGHNVLLDVECASTIVRHPGGYQTSRWRGVAVPSTVDPQWLRRTEDRR